MGRSIGSYHPEEEDTITTRTSTALLDGPIEPFAPDEAELPAVAFLAPYSGRTLDAYRHDLRNLFLWAARSRPARAI